MLDYKKGVLPVVAASLLIVVAVIGVISFEIWFSTYSSSVFGGVEQKSELDNNDNIGIEVVVGSSLYLNAGDSLTINSLKVDGVDCGVNGSFVGMEEIDLSSCIGNVTTSSAEIVIYSAEGVFSKHIFVKDVGSLSGGSAPLSCINVSSGLVGMWSFEESIPSNIVNLPDYSDNFNDNSFNSSKWTILRENPGYWSESAGKLHITTAGDDFWKTTNTAPLFWQTIDPNLNYEVTVDVSASPTSNYHQGGIMFWGSDNDYLRLTMGYFSGVYSRLSQEIGGTFTESGSLFGGVNSYKMKIVKNGDVYYGFSSLDGGINYTIGSTREVVINPTRIGITAFHSSGKVFDFDNFEVNLINKVNFTDSSVNNVDSFCYNCPSSVLGKVGNGIELNGRDDFLEMDSSGVDGKSISVSVWVYPYTDGPASETSRIVSRDRSDYWMLGQSYNNSLEWTVYAGGVYQNYTAEDVLNTNQWNHIVATYDGDTGAKRVYVDGSLIHDETIATTGLIGSGSVRNLGIGCNVEAFLDGTYRFTGKIDEVAIYNHSLTSSEVLELYNGNSLGSVICS